MRISFEWSARTRAAIALALAIGFAPGALGAIQTQTRSTAATVTPGGGWATPNNAASINGACALGDGTTSGSITMTDWTFAIPGGSTILGITVRSVASFNDVSTEDQISLTKAGSAVGSPRTLNGPGASAAISCGSPVPDANGLTVGGAADLWGTTWTVAEINDSGFGVFYDNSFFNNAIDGVEITVTYNDNLGPTVTVDKSPGQLDPTGASPIQFTVAFSANVTGFDASDVSFATSTAGGPLVAAVAGGPAVYTVSVTGMTSSGTVVVSIPANAAFEGVNGNAASTPIDNVVQYDNIPPSVTIEQHPGQQDPVRGSTLVRFRAVFDEPVTGFGSADVSLAGSTAGGPLAVDVSGGPTEFIVTVTGMSSAGTIVASIPAGVAVDIGAAGNNASTSTDNSVTWLGPPQPIPALDVPALGLLMLFVAALGAVARRKARGDT